MPTNVDYGNIVTHHHSEVCPDNRAPRRDASTTHDLHRISSVYEWFGRLTREQQVSFVKTIEQQYRVMITMVGDRHTLWLAAIAHVFGHKTKDSSDDTFNTTYFEEQSNKLLHGPMSALSAEDLDRLWILFYATGNVKYAHRVLDVAANVVTPVGVRDAAHWSYNSHLADGRLLEDPPANIVASVMIGDD